MENVTENKSNTYKYRKKINKTNFEVNMLFKKIYNISNKNQKIKFCQEKFILNMFS